MNIFISHHLRIHVVVISFEMDNITLHLFYNDELLKEVLDRTITKKGGKKNLILKFIC